MLFQFDISLTEEDYLAFNYFHSFDSVQGKKQIRKLRLVFIGVMMLLIGLVLLILERSVFSLCYAAILGAFTLVYMLLYKRILKRSIKTQIGRLKKTGKLPYDPVSTIEFHEDGMAEICASRRTEQNYSLLERVCVVKDQYLFLYYSSVNAYILPVRQVRAQANEEELLRFLSGKCARIEYY